jgi:hypothetical protein
MDQSEIRISLKGVAEFIAASPLRQRKTLQDQKYREKGEGKARSMYYSDATKAIIGYHVHHSESIALLDAADSLAKAATEAIEANKPRRAHRLRHNERGLRAYHQLFTNETYEVLSRSRLKLIIRGVTIKAAPDLLIKRADVWTLVKLEFGKRRPTATLVSVLLEGLSRAASSRQPPLEPHSVEVWHVPSGERITRSAGADPHGLDILERACGRIAELWPAIEPPKKARAA